MTLTERLTRTGEAILDLASALPDDLDLVTVHTEGYDYRGRPDVVVHADGLGEGLRAIRALGGIWQHSLSRHAPGADKVHHRWDAEFQGWTVRVVAIWNGSNLFAEDIQPLVAVS